MRVLPRRVEYLNAAVLGAGAAGVTVLIAVAVHLPRSGDALAVVQTSLLLLGLLLVPASIYAPVMGSMFPSYWNATPVTLIRVAPLDSLLRLLVWAGSYGFVLVVVGMVIGLSAVVTVPLVIGVAAGAYLAAHLVAFTLSIFDPLEIVKVLAEGARTARVPSEAAGAVGDLCRFLRGMVERDRRTVAENAIDALAEIWTVRGPELASTRALTLRVLGEAARKWPRSEVAAAAERCERAVAKVLPPPAPGQSVGPAPGQGVQRRDKTSDHQPE